MFRATLVMTAEGILIKPYLAPSAQKGHNDQVTIPETWGKP